jgi:hypothetical protein
MLQLKIMSDVITTKVIEHYNKVKCLEIALSWEVNWALRHLSINESVSVYKETESSLHTQKITFWRT